MRVAFLIGISALVLALTACGQTGALYLPESSEPAAEEEAGAQDVAGTPDLEEDPEDDIEEDDAPEP